MSSKAQREDIYDPEVVHGFAQAVKSEMRLDYLYALTVADINATNPTLWNSWRATLLRQLYTETRKALRRGLESSADRNATVAAYQERAMDRLAEIRPDLEVTRIRDLWSDLGDDFFLRHSPVQIAHLTELLSEHDVQGKPLVTVQDTHGDLPGEGATQVYVYTMDQPMLFALTVVSLSQFELSVVDATINTSTRGVCFDTYTVLDQDGNPLAPESPLRERIAEGLRDNIVKRKMPKLTNNRLLPRQLRDMSHATEVSLKPTGDDESSTLIILASDRPGLLATIGLLFAELGLQLLSARITTLGERIEDTFVIQTSDGAPVAAGEDTYTLEQSIRQRLDTALGV
jgi:[protein-PII] uridylyltransferase